MVACQVTSGLVVSDCMPSTAGALGVPAVFYWRGGA